RPGAAGDGGHPGERASDDAPGAERAAGRAGSGAFGLLIAHRVRACHEPFGETPPGRPPLPAASRYCRRDRYRKDRRLMALFAPRSPVEERERRWIEKMLGWCAEQFGRGPLG